MSEPSPLEEVLRTRRQGVAAALRIALAEQEMGGVPSRAMKADDAFDIAARNHVRAIEALEPLRRPKGWADPAVLLSPECRAGKHHDCDGVPCEDSCHTSGIEGVAP